MFGIAVNHHPLKIEVDGHTVVEPLADDGLALNVDVLSLLQGQCVDVFAVQVQRHGLGLHADGDLVPVAVEQIVHLRVFEHGSDRVLRETRGVVLHRFVLPVQSDGNLWDSVFVVDLPQVPVLTPRGFPELEGGDKRVFVWQSLRKHVFCLLDDGHGPQTNIRALSLVVSRPQNVPNVEIVHQVEPWHLVKTVTRAVWLEAIGLNFHVWTQHIFAEPLPQTAPDLVDGVEVRHMEHVCVLGLGGDLLQLLLQRFSDPHREHPDPGFSCGFGRFQNVILTAAVREEDGHALDPAGLDRSGPVPLREDVGGGVADGVSGHGVPSEVAYVPGRSLHVVQAPVSSQVELDGWAVAVADHGHAGFVRRHVEGFHQVRDPLTNLLEVLLPHAGGRVQDERQVVVNVFTACPLCLYPLLGQSQGQTQQDQSDPESQSESHLGSASALLRPTCYNHQAALRLFLIWKLRFGPRGGGDQHLSSILQQIVIIQNKI